MGNSNSPKPPTQQPSTFNIQIQVADSVSLAVIVGATVVDDAIPSTGYSAVTDANGLATLGPYSHAGFNLIINSCGYNQGVIPIPNLGNQTHILQLVKTAPIFPAQKTRTQICSMHLMFQGLTVVTSQYGTLPWFDPGLVGLNAADRLAVYKAKLAVGDTHCIFDFSTNNRPVYDEAGQPYQAITTLINESTPDTFLSLVEEVIQNNLVPVIAYDGDDGDNEPYGSANALRQLPILNALLKTSKYRDLNQDVLLARFWDGVFYGSSPANIQAFGQSFRQINPNGYLAIEFQPGKIPLGNGEADYQPGGMMVDYDVICAEFSYSNDTPPNDTLWQIAGRTVRPYNRPSDQPVGDDPNPPFYLSQPSPRGPYFSIGFEWEGAYYWVRGQSTSEQEAARRTYISNLGYGALTG